MKKYLSTVQKQMGVMISIILFGFFVNNSIKLYLEGDEFVLELGNLYPMILFIILIPFVISIFVENKFLKILQVLFILGKGIINIMVSYESFYGPGMFFVAWLLMRRYGFFDSYRKLKYLLFLLFLLILPQVSSFIHNQGSIYAGLPILKYSLFITIFIIIIWRDMIAEQEKLRIENKSLKINYTRLRDKLIEIEEERKPFDLKALKITLAEERVIKVLTIYKASNKEIAERLNIAESTVKLHLYNIYNKIGVDNRFAIIDLCKYNYIQ